MLYIHPAPQRDLFLGSGDRLGAVIGGLVYGAIGIGQAVVFASLRYHRIRLPDTWSYPGALLNSTVTAFVDEVAFRGAIFGLLLSTGLDADRREHHPDAAVRADDAARAHPAATATCSS